MYLQVAGDFDEVFNVVSAEVHASVVHVIDGSGESLVIEAKRHVTLASLQHVVFEHHLEVTTRHLHHLLVNLGRGKRGVTG